MSNTTPLEPWGDDVPLRGPDAPKDDGKIKHLIEYLLTVYKRFGNTVVTVNLQWGASALHKLSEERERIATLEAELATLRSVQSETRALDLLKEARPYLDLIAPSVCKERPLVMVQTQCDVEALAKRIDGLIGEQA